jgi:hypothetical protein
MAGFWVGVRTSPKIDLHLPEIFCTSPEPSCTFPSETLNDISKWKVDKFLCVVYPKQPSKQLQKQPQNNLKTTP